ncbi:hypothetical protein HK100_005945 [Physocladia obscura]|uniref:Uncharacterized protein n=1 Tax=Physocladia obscura TaxID=109957 RepID=A0AAD5ST27_9FUNG|nr:hypothetical protein HK100_005945 [Physocladia obscura]
MVQAATPELDDVSTLGKKLGFASPPVQENVLGNRQQPMLVDQAYLSRTLSNSGTPALALMHTPRIENVSFFLDYTPGNSPTASPPVYQEFGTPDYNFQSFESK